MNATRIARLTLLALCLSAFGLTGHAQDKPAAQEYQPEVGQSGKDVVWVPTPQALVDKMLNLARVTPRDYVIDLGSGDGRTVITAVKRGARALGIEYNPDMVALSQRNAAKEGVGDKAKFMKADLFETDFSQATVITMFLLPDINIKLRPKILDMKPGTRIVSNSFTMGEWQHERSAKATEKEGCQSYCTAYLWIVPAKVEGTWKLADGELKLKQDFQNFSGTLTAGGRQTAVKGRLYGDRINFKAGDSQYTGRVNGDAIQGTVKSGGGAGEWSATRTAKG
ncbi:MAG: class I SAM-dependent methyltransferase [Betaproteobacteria bacterium]|nr:class I SAM-dependent methyltransferase [Betaproteobacteria bacterium]